MTTPSGETPRPDGGCDCHAHVFGPLDRFAYKPDRSYTAAEALPQAYRAMHARIGVRRGVLIQPSVYGTDNSAMVNALGILGADYRAVAVVAPDIANPELEALHRAGVRGIRLARNLPGGISIDHLEAMATRLKPFGWHIQLLTDVSEIAGLRERIARLDVPVVIDHFGLLHLSRRTANVAAGTLVDLVRNAGAWLKVSAPYLVSDRHPDYPDVEPVARRLAAEVPERLVWGTDWPHPAAVGHVPDDGHLLALFRRWVGDPTVARRILVDNPARLYGFAPQPS